MKLFDLFKQQSPYSSIIKPIPFNSCLWNQEWYSIEFRVSGVTFENRQSILKKLDNGKPQMIYFKKSECDGSPCVEVYSNNMMVGYIPEKQLNEFLKWCDKPCSIKYSRIIKSKNTYGLLINIVFEDIIPAKFRNIVYETEYLIVGVDYPCRKNKEKKRKDIIKHMHSGNIVVLEKYTYQGSAAYMIVDPKSSLDLGVLSAGAAEYIYDHYPNAIFDASLSSKYKNSYHVLIKVIQRSS